MTLRKPEWLRRKIPNPGRAGAVSRLISDKSLHTVCQEALCPNCMECFGQGTATFLLLGPDCTRNCTFCAVGKKSVAPPDANEPDRVAQAIARMGLTFSVLTMVTRDDLTDGGAGHMAEAIRAIRIRCPGVGVEVLISDLGGSEAALNRVLEATPEVLNHNIETIERLYPEVRPMAEFNRSLKVLSQADSFRPRPVIKSGLMLGLGETKQEILETLEALKEAGCDSVTLGQYLAPSKGHHPIVRYVPPSEFEELKESALAMGFTGVASGPYVRSSYKAEELFKLASQNKDDSLHND